MDGEFAQQHATAVPAKSPSSCDTRAPRDIEMSMTDPMNALVQLQSALDGRIIQLRQCEIHKDVSVFVDHPRGLPRFTYAKVKQGKVQSISLLVNIQPIDGALAFQMGWATLEPLRGRGLATDVVTKSIDELRSGLKRNGHDKFYLEAIISITNEHSNKLAKKLVSDSPVSCTDAVSGEPALQYLRLVQ
jgi:hypothetical protein